MGFLLLAFDGMGFMVRVMVAISLSRPLLARQLLLSPQFRLLVVGPPPQALVVVEDGGTYGLLGPVLTDNIVVDAGLQVTRIELWDPEGWSTEHGSSACVVGGVITAIEPAVEVIWSFGESRCCKGIERAIGDISGEGLGVGSY